MKSFILLTLVSIGICTTASAQVLYSSTTEVGGRFNVGLGQAATPKIAFDDISIANSSVPGTDSISITKVKVGIRRIPGAPATDVNFYYTPYDDTATVLNNYISIPPVLIGKVSLPANNSSLSTTIVSIGDSISALFKIKSAPNNLFSGYQTFFIGTALSNPDPGNALRFTSGPAQNVNQIWIYNVDSAVQRCQGTFDNFVATYYLQVFGNQSSLLPVTYSSFTGEQKAEGNNLLNWTTEMEVNSKSFELQRSGNGTDYKTIASIKSKNANGTSNLRQTYSYLDASAIRGKDNYYRIQQTDINGRFTFSPVVLIKDEKQTIIESTKIFPNPAKSVVNFQLTSSVNQKISITVADFTGRVVINKSEKAVQGTNNFSINVTMLSSGNYSVKAVKESEQSTSSYKFIKQ